jgi:hypothetical protein
MAVYMGETYVYRRWSVDGNDGPLSGLSAPQSDSHV